MSHLYTSASGREVTHGSSSSLDTFRLCRRKFKLSRIDGWKQKARKASLEIGKCLESALQFYHDNGLNPGDFEDEWKRLWLKFEPIELVYTDQEKDWKSVYTLGSEWARLYQILLPTFPIRNPKFQLQFLKKLWPGSDLDDLEFMGYVDILSTLADGSRCVIDVKTAKTRLSIAPGMMALDGQLRKYAWLSGITNVGFLNFVKCDPNSFRKGVDITLLEDCGDWKAGQELVILGAVDPKEGDERQYFNVATEATVQLMDEELDQISGKGSKEKKEQVYQSYAVRSLVNTVPRDFITKAKLQMVCGTIPEGDLPEIGQQIGQDMLGIKSAFENNAFFKDGGVRFPNAICSWCEMLPICNRNDARRDETLVQIKPAPAAKETDWLDELEAEEGE